MSTLAILSQDGITSGSVNISVWGGSFTVPAGVTKLYANCHVKDSASGYLRVTPGSRLTVDNYETTYELDSGSSIEYQSFFDCWVELASNNSKYFTFFSQRDYINNPTITFSWSNAINNYTGGAADLTA